MEVVSIVVGIGRRLASLRKALEERGYKVVDLEDCNYLPDAIVYEGSILQIPFSLNSDAYPDQTLDNADRGIFLLNSEGRSIDEIETMLKNRCYSRLF